MEIFDNSKIGEMESRVGNLIVECGANLRQIWHKNKNVSMKLHGEPVTEYDIKLERDLREELHGLLPQAGFLVEEGEDTTIKDYMWIIDPIDQTRNFIGQIPLFYIQVSLSFNETPILGVIYNPVSDQLFSASRGNGSKLNNTNIPKRIYPRLPESIIDIEFGGNQIDNLEWKLNQVNKLAHKARRIRLTGGSFAPYILTGGVDVYLSINEKTRIMDQYPRMVLMRECGLKCEQFEVDNRKITMAAEPGIYDEILRLLIANNI